MNALIFIILLLFFSQVDSLCQNLNFDVSSSSIGANGVVRFNDPSQMGKSNSNFNYSDVRGSYFLNDDWSPMKVQLMSGAVVAFSKANFNLFTNEIHFFKTDQELSAPTSKVLTISIYNRKDTLQLESKLEKRVLDGNQFFLMPLNDGKIRLMKSVKVDLFKGDYDPTRGKPDLRFIRKINYYILNQDALFPLTRLGKENILGVLPNSLTNERWLNEKKNKLKTELEVSTFLQFINR